MHRLAGDEMSSATLEESARQWAIDLENREAERSGASLRAARKTVARRLGVAPGTLENLRLRRIKGVRAWVLEALRAAVIREAELEIAKLENVIRVARATGVGSAESEVGALEFRLEKLKTARS